MKKILMRINFIHEEFLKRADRQGETLDPKFDAEYWVSKNHTCKIVF